MKSTSVMPGSIRGLHILLVLLFVSVACSSQGVLPATPTPTQDFAALHATATKKAEAEQVFGTLVAMTTATSESAGTATAQATLYGPRTATAAADKTRVVVQRNARSTATAEARQTATQQVAAQATSAAESFLPVIQSLAERGLLSTTTGEYIQLDDYLDSLAEPGMYQWARSFESVREFVIRVDTTWDSKKGDWSLSGCGIVFSDEGVNNHYVAFLGLDGYVTLVRVKEKKMRPVGRDRYGELDVPQGKAEVILIVENGYITILVNGKKVMRLENGGYDTGDLGFAVLSGSDKSYGMRCNMENIQLWKIH